MRKIEEGESMIKQLHSSMEIISVVLLMADREAKAFTGSIINSSLLKMDCRISVGVI